MNRRGAWAPVAARPGGWFEGEEEGKPGEITASNPAVAKLIADAVAAEVIGLKANNEELIGEKRTAKKDLADLQKLWEGMDAGKVRALVARFENDEEAQLIADGKVDEVIDRRVGAMRTDLEGQITQATEKITEHEGTVGRLTGRIKKLLLEKYLIQAAATEGVVPSAMQDVLARAMQVFVLNDDEELEAREGEVLLKGKDGKSKLMPGEWLPSMQTACPHWWPPSQGGGTNGGDGGAGSQMDSKRLETMSPREKLRTAIAGQG